MTDPRLTHLARCYLGISKCGDCTDATTEACQECIDEVLEMVEVGVGIQAQTAYELDRRGQDLTMQHVR